MGARGWLAASGGCTQRVVGARGWLAAMDSIFSGWDGRVMPLLTSWWASKNGAPVPPEKFHEIAAACMLIAAKFEVSALPITTFVICPRQWFVLITILMDAGAARHGPVH